MIRIELPAHLRTLAKVKGEIQLPAQSAATIRTVLDALESAYPVLKGAIRDRISEQRRPFVRFFACQEDLSHHSPDTPVPDAIASGKEPFLVIGAIAGG